jgi:hypothetical protein
VGRPLRAILLSCAIVSLAGCSFFSRHYSESAMKGSWRPYTEAREAAFKCIAWDIECDHNGPVVAMSGAPSDSSDGPSAGPGDRGQDGNGGGGNGGGGNGGGGNGNGGGGNGGGGGGNGGGGNGGGGNGGGGNNGFGNGDQDAPGGSQPNNGAENDVSANGIGNGGGNGNGNKK